MFDSSTYYDDDWGWSFFIACKGCGHDAFRYAGTPGFSPRLAIPNDPPSRERSREEVEKAAMAALLRDGWTTRAGQAFCRVCSLTHQEG